MKEGDDAERGWSQFGTTLKRVWKIKIWHPIKHAPHHRKRRFLFGRKDVDEPTTTQSEDSSTCDGSSGLETISPDDGDENEHESEPLKRLRELVNTRIWIKGPPGSKEKSFGLKIDTGAYKNVVTKETARKIRDTWGFKPERLRKRQAFRTANGQIMWSRKYIKLRWMRAKPNTSSDAKSNTSSEWPESIFYILPAPTRGQPVPFDFLIGLEGIAELGDAVKQELQFVEHHFN